MDYTVSEVLQYVQENDVKFIRLAFCDIFGNIKNVSIMPGELARAFDTGVSFDASRLPGMMDFGESDLFLVPDPATLTVLPWRPSHGRVVRLFCGIRYPDGTPFPGDGRSLLKATQARLKEQGYAVQIGTECEFYLFERDDAGQPTTIPFDRAGYLDVAPLDKGENVRRDICLTLEKMGIAPSASHHEKGPGQNEIHFRAATPVRAADNFITFKSVVKTMAATNGLFASFMPMPLAQNAASGLHINMNMKKGGEDVFAEQTARRSPARDHFIAGILDHIAEITVFLNPLTNSYARFGKGAPANISWSRNNLTNLLRVKQGEFGGTLNLRSPDSALNPYLALSLILNAGLDGISRSLPLCPPADTKDDIAAGACLPKTLKEAAETAQQSSFVRSVLPDKLTQFYLGHKIAEFEALMQAEDRSRYEHDAYFITI